VILAGGNRANPPFFTTIAQDWAFWYNIYNPSQTAYVYEVRNVDDVQSALNTPNIDTLLYFGHGGSQDLYLSSSGKLTGDDVDTLNISNVQPGATIALFSCSAANDDFNIAQDFANHFSTDVLGNTGGVSFGFTAAGITFLGSSPRNYNSDSSWKTVSPENKDKIE